MPIIGTAGAYNTYMPIIGGARWFPMSFPNYMRLWNNFPYGETTQSHDVFLHFPITEVKLFPMMDYTTSQCCPNLGSNVFALGFDDFMMLDTTNPSLDFTQLLYCVCNPNIGFAGF